MEEFRDRLRTVDNRGNRLWVYTDIASGFWRSRRRWFAYLLMTFYICLPWMRYKNLPVFQIDLAQNHIVFLGQIFFSSEVSLFIPLVFGFVLFVLALTSWAGRVWCGWACPQTVFLEFLYRPFEQLIEGRPGARRILDQAPFHLDKFLKKTLKWSVFAVFSFIVANTFLAFFIGTNYLTQVVTSAPAQNMGLFLTMLIVFFGFLFNFGWFREQMCTIACPYGRFQSVLLDSQSSIIGYDKARGEPRGRKSGGDCVDCKRCVQVCPTGIDIRDGVQLECVNCAACIDACNIVMSKLNRQPNLISYTSEKKLAKVSQKFRLRPIIYLALSILMFSFGAYGMMSRSLLEVEVLRSGAVQFKTGTDGLIHNHVRLRITNKTLSAARLEFSSRDPRFEVIAPQDKTPLEGQSKDVYELFVKAPQEQFTGGISHLKIDIRAATASSVFLKTQTLNLFGPEK